MLVQSGLKRALNQLNRPVLAMIFEVDATGIAVHQSAALIFAPKRRGCALAVDASLDIWAVGLGGCTWRKSRCTGE